MNIDINNCVSLVTGGARGIGRQCAIRLAEAGSDVIVNYVSSRTAATAVADEVTRLGRRCWIVKGDVSEQDDVQCMMDFIRDEIGQLNVIVSNAASGGFRPLLSATSNNFDAAFHTNVLALVYLIQSALPLLEVGPRRGKVITISSHGSILAMPWYGLVGSSKAALESIVRHLTLEIGDRNVNINVVRAGLVETDSTRRFPNADQMFAEQVNHTQVGERILTADDVANVVAFLACPMSDLIQGETITIDGGAGIRVA
ncbi:MAG: SDR family oxidoreductase [Planctomycetota bacterium]|nr:SDR family oxidoreductase [Planctomycetota bacterium]